LVASEKLIPVSLHNGLILGLLVGSSP
jgi:hypothetical protein